MSYKVILNYYKYTYYYYYTSILSVHYFSGIFEDQLFLRGLKLTEISLLTGSLHSGQPVSDFPAIFVVHYGKPQLYRSKVPSSVCPSTIPLYSRVILRSDTLPCSKPGSTEMKSLRLSAFADIAVGDIRIMDFGSLAFADEDESTNGHSSLWSTSKREVSLHFQSLKGTFFC